MEKPKDPKIVITNIIGKELSVTVSWEADIYEWIDTFKLILRWLTFSPEEIDKLLGQKNEEV